MIGVDFSLSISDEHEKEILISQMPVIILPSTINIVYMIPRHTTSPRNIFVIGIENPMDAYIQSLAIVLRL